MYWASPLHYAFATLVIGEVYANSATYGVYGRCVLSSREPGHKRGRCG